MKALRSFPFSQNFQFGIPEPFKSKRNDVLSLSGQRASFSNFYFGQTESASGLPLINLQAIYPDIYNKTVVMRLSDYLIPTGKQ